MMREPRARQFMQFIHSLWQFLLPNYLITIAIETPILLIGLSKLHSLRTRLIAGVWLTACTYPIVVLVLPLLLEGWSRPAYLWVAEIFAPLAECLIFCAAFERNRKLTRGQLAQDWITIILANLASFGIGELMLAWRN